MRYLVVEDQAVIAHDVAWVIKNVLQADTVEIAATSAKAVALLISGCVDAPILDVYLADGTSEAVASELLKRHVPYCVLSGCMEPNRLPSPLNSSLILEKPYEQSELISRLRVLERLARQAQPDFPGRAATSH